MALLYAIQVVPEHFAHASVWRTSKGSDATESVMIIFFLIYLTTILDLSIVSQWS